MNIAIIDDQVDIRYAVEKILSKQGHTCYGFSGSEEDLIEGIDVFDIDLIILDMMLEDSLTGIDVIEKIKNASYQIPTILITAYTTPSNLINAAKSGIIDIIEKPFSTSDILKIVAKYEKREKPFFLKNNNEEFIGSFETMKKIYSKIGIAAKSDLNILIFGETGTGKELVSKLIHKNSSKSSQPFIAVNCATIPQGMFESMFYGHKKGSFPNADKDQIGYASLAGEGTLFLDEISELKQPLQSKLLRFLESKKFSPLGFTQEIEFKGRIICASLENPKKLIEKNLFRNDLYHRISMIEIELPNLSERKKDIKDLSLHFIKSSNTEMGNKIEGIEEEAIIFLKNHKFSGNVRELKNTIYKAVLNSRHETITCENIKDILNTNTEISVENICKNLVDLYRIEHSKKLFEDVEKGILKELLERCPNISQLAKYMDISRNTLKSKLDKIK